MAGQKITYDKHCKVEFGTYVQVNEKNNNSMEPRPSGAIAHRPTKNEQGCITFSAYTLEKNSKKKLDRIVYAKRRSRAMHRLAAASEQAEGITFTDKNGNFITENDQEDKNATDYAHIPVINNDNGEHMSFNREEMGNEGNDQAIIGVEEQDNVTNNNVLEQAITGLNKQDNMTSNNVS